VEYYILEIAEDGSSICQIRTPPALADFHSGCDVVVEKESESEGRRGYRDI
jgi:hypothetical protein